MPKPLVEIVVFGSPGTKTLRALFCPIGSLDCRRNARKNNNDTSLLLVSVHFLHDILRIVRIPETQNTNAQTKKKTTATTTSLLSVPLSLLLFCLLLLELLLFGCSLPWGCCWLFPFFPDYFFCFKRDTRVSTFPFGFADGHLSLLEIWNAAVSGLMVFPVLMGLFNMFVCLIRQSTMLLNLTKEVREDEVPFWLGGRKTSRVALSLVQCNEPALRSRMFLWLFWAGIHIPCI